MGELFIGIDVGGTSVKAAGLADGEIVWTGRSERYSRATTEQLVAAIGQACGTVKEPIVRVGLCVPGLLDEHKTHVMAAANVPGLVGVPLAELVKRVLAGVAAAPVVVNDANATGYDVYSLWRPVGRLLTLAIGTGVGACVLDDGKPLQVDGESPGHIGQLDVSIEGARVLGPDGGRGGLEGYLGTLALRKRYGSDPSSKIRPGDPAFKALVRTIRICHAIYRPHHVCLAGGTGIRLARLIDPIVSAVNQDLTSVARKDWGLFTADSDFHAAAGAARIAAGGAWPP